MEKEMTREAWEQMIFGLVDKHQAAEIARQREVWERARKEVRQWRLRMGCKLLCLVSAVGMVASVVMATQGKDSWAGMGLFLLVFILAGVGAAE